LFHILWLFNDIKYFILYSNNKIACYLLVTSAHTTTDCLRMLYKAQNMKECFLKCCAFVGQIKQNFTNYTLITIAKF